MYPSNLFIPLPLHNASANHVIRQPDYPIIILDVEGVRPFLMCARQLSTEAPQKFLNFFKIIPTLFN